jgi:hypothetical protein
MKSAHRLHTLGKGYLLSWVAYVLLLISFACTIRAERREGCTINASDKAFFEQIRNAILKDDIDWLANSITYPIVLRPNGRKIAVSNKRDLKKRAKLILNEHLKSLVSTQYPDTLFKNWQGVMIGDGEIWFSEVVDKEQEKQGWVFRIIAINLNTAPI